MDKHQEQVSAEGYTAHTTGKPLEANPYPTGIEDHVWWETGWIDAQLDSLNWMNTLEANNA